MYKICWHMPIFQDKAEAAAYACSCLELNEVQITFSHTLHCQTISVDLYEHSLHYDC